MAKPAAPINPTVAGSGTGVNDTCIDGCVVLLCHTAPASLVNHILTKVKSVDEL